MCAPTAAAPQVYLWQTYDLRRVEITVGGQPIAECVQPRHISA